MLTVEKLHKSFGAQVVLKEVNLVIGSQERVGIVGHNGAGKSTLVKILAGMEEADKGIVNIHGASVGYLNQESQCRLGVTVGEEMRDALPGVADVEAQLARAAENIDMSALSKATDDMQRLETHTLNARIGRVLSGLGFEQGATERLTDTYSGGWQMRIAMAKLLLQEPAYLFLDEPTNHLDTTAKYWLMYDYIPSYPGSVVVVSHEIEFLNIVSERIVEVDAGEIKEFKGNYDDYQQQKQEAHDRQLKEYESQQKELADWREFIARFKGNKSKAGMVESRERQIAKLAMVARPRDRQKTIYLQLPAPPPSSPDPVTIKNVVKRYDNHTILDGVSLEIVKGDKIALVGPNGAGKSTLLKLVAGVEPITEGTIDVRPKTVMAYFAQHQAEALIANRTVMEETLYGLDHAVEELARGLLARLLFRNDEVFKKVGVLSGGERSRVALAKFLLRPANFYLLDEPTNHLDPAARGVLIEALSRFEGTILMASHDVELIENAATGVFEVEGGKLIMVKDPVIARIQEE